MSKALIILIILLGFLIIFVSYFGLYQANSFIGRASISLSSFSPQNSYVFSTPLQAKADQKEKIRVTLFLLNEEGIGVANRKLSIAPIKGLDLKVIQGITDQSGKAVFDIASSTTGEYYIPIRIDGLDIQKQAHVRFY